MLNQCGHQSSVYPCSCGFVYGGGGGGGGASFSFLYPVTTTKQFMQEGCDSDEYSGCSSPSSVDCTLSLGTPSTRQTEHKTSESYAKIQRSSSCMWDIRSQSKNSSSMGSNASPNGGGSALGGDPQLFARRCANCDTTSTPLWRNGPRGPKSLCNACGIRFKKEERRAAASTAPPSSSPVAGEYGYHHRQDQSPWSCYASSAIKSSSSLTLYDDVADNGEGPYRSWQFNIAPPGQFSVRDRPSLSQFN
ncbi:GATA transcription factor 15-like [Curcuma longa]|uniref:GATA transcription factor 15-like n=1 Tax=Curcuma longa TaxID=136217 RepID=UPI003D9ED092